LLLLLQYVIIFALHVQENAENRWRTSDWYQKSDGLGARRPWFFSQPGHRDLSVPYHVQIDSQAHSA